MTTKQKSRRPAGHVRAPKRNVSRQRTVSPWLVGAAAAGIVGLAVVIGTLVFGGGSTSTIGGLPNTPDYHSLLVSPSDPMRIRLGTHQGIFRSSDGGKTWQADALAGKDAMNLARPRGQTVWMAGHNVFEKSEDGGRSWQSVEPASLPSLDIHGFAVDPRYPDHLYAAVAGEGLYRSTDGGVTFSRLSDVGGAVMALAITRNGEILAGDMQRGLLASPDGGRTWRDVLTAQLMGIAINPAKPNLILATGPGILRSTDGGRTWTQVLELADGAGPVAWSPSRPNTAYVVGFDRTLYRTEDAGASWTAVSG